MGPLRKIEVIGAVIFIATFVDAEEEGSKRKRKETSDKMTKKRLSNFCPRKRG